MARRAPVGMLAVALTLALAACGGSAATPGPTAAPTATPAPAPTVPPPTPTLVPSPTAVALPATTLRVALDRPFASAGQSFDPAKMGGLGPASLVAQWYQDGGWFIVAYVGLNLASSGPLCPGNSLQVGNGFQYVSNAPTAPGACEGVSTLQPPPVGVRLCGSQVLYRTAIPATAKGILWASINHQLGGGAYVGLAGLIDGSTGAAPQISVEALACRSAA